MAAFEKLEKAREGIYNKVYRAREKTTAKIVALKKTRLYEDEEGVSSTTLRLISVLRLMDMKQGQNKEGKTVLYLVFEYMDANLKKFICSFCQIGENILLNTIKSLMYQLCKGVAFCHGHGVLHKYLAEFKTGAERKEAAESTLTAYKAAQVSLTQTRIDTSELDEDSDGFLQPHEMEAYI